MTAEDLELQHRAALASLTPVQVLALKRQRQASIRRWTRGGHERDHLRDICREEAAATAAPL